MDVTFNFHTSKYFPFCKPNNDSLYINIKSNQPDTIKKELPRIVDKRISEISCNKEKFDKAKGIYQKALNESDFKVALNFNEQQTERTGTEKIIWFNPSYESVKTNIGRQFLKLIRKYFPKQQKFTKIFSSNTNKLSCSCTANMKNLIKQHNSKILNNTPTQ